MAFWAACAARAARVAALSAHDFWNLTPCEVDSILFEALDEKRADRYAASYNAALICSVLCNINRDSRKKPEPFTPDDFLPRIEKPAPPRPLSVSAVTEKAKSALNLIAAINPP